MFNDTYGLTAAVIERRKTNTRRTCKEKATNKPILANDVYSWRYYPEENIVEFLMNNGDLKVSVPPYKVGEVAAVAQRYCDLCREDFSLYKRIKSECKEALPQYELKGWQNKMFVKAAYMPHQVRFTDMKVERLQDISEEDALKEGIVVGEMKHKHPKEFVKTPMPYGSFLPFSFHGAETDYFCAKDAFAALINNVSGKGTWERNPYCFCYEFKLIK